MRGRGSSTFPQASGSESWPRDVFGQAEAEAEAEVGFGGSSSCGGGAPVVNPGCSESERRPPERPAMPGQRRCDETRRAGPPGSLVKLSSSEVGFGVADPGNARPKPR
jgi:hypothetical protein